MIVPSTQLLERAVRSYVAEGSDLAAASVIPGNPKGPSPKGLYATVLSISELPEGYPWNREAERNAASVSAPVDTFESVDIEYSVQWYRSGARDAARLFRLWARSPMGIDAAARRGLTCYSVDGVRQIDAILSEEWEQRAGVDLRMGITNSARVDPALLQSIDIDIHFEGMTANLELRQE